MRRVTLELPDEVLDRAERLAVLTHRDVADVLAEAVSAVLPPVDATSDGVKVSRVSDVAVLRLANISSPFRGCRTRDRSLCRNTFRRTLKQLRG